MVVGGLMGELFHDSAAGQYWAIRFVKACMLLASQNKF